MHPTWRDVSAETGAAQVVEDIVRQAAFRWEAAISAVRATFCVIVLARLVVTGVSGQYGSARMIMGTPLLVALVGFSIWAVARVRSGRATGRLLVLSVAVDAIGCFLALATNVLAPWSVYDGILRIPDFAALLVVTTASGFRLSPTAARLGCACHALSASTLVAIDLTRNASRVAYGARDVVFFGILVLSAMLLALVISTRVHRLVHEGAAQQVAAERAKLNLWQLLEGNHEMRSALSAVALETDMFLRAAAKEGKTDQEEVVRIGRDLRAELARLNALVVSIRERTYAELATMQGAERMDVAGAVDEAIARLRSRFPDVIIERTGARDAHVVIAGGAQSLDRVLSNLLVNACEGDGRSRPTRVEVDVRRRDGERIAICVRDDGPGFPPEVLASTLDTRGPTTKPDGSGLGLFLVHAIVSATGGSLERANGARGAEVIVHLPAARG